MENLLTLLVARCPEISDPAKITLTEILVHHLTGAKKVPSLTQLSTVRGKARSVIASHMKELRDAGIIEVVQRHGKRKVLFDLDRLAKLIGFPSKNSIDFDVFLRSFTVGTLKKSKRHLNPRSQLFRKTSSKWTPTDLLLYFDLKYKEVYKRDRRDKSNDRKIFRLLAIQYDPRTVRDMIDHYARYWKQMRLGAFRPSLLYKHRERLAEKVQEA